MTTELDITIAIRYETLSTSAAAAGLFISKGQESTWDHQLLLM
jgi:hypothetical protein